MSLFGKIFAVLLSLLAAVWMSSRADAEVSEIRIAHQFGLGYLTLYVMEDQKLVTRCAKENGAGDLTVKWSTVGSTAMMADGIIGGSFDVASAGVPPFLFLWDKTKGAVRMISALNMQPMTLNTNNPNVKSARDLSEKDRIAVPATKSSTHSILLGMASEKIWGEGNYKHFENIQVPMAHPDATAALLARSGQVTTHFSTIPFTAIQLADPKIHTILTSRDILGGPATIVSWWTTERFRHDNPKAYQALLCAAERATGFINKNRSAAAEVYKRMERSKLSVQQIESLLADPEIVFTLTPERTFVFADYMFRTGLIRSQPKSWKDIFFPEVHQLSGS